jgi:hypothetical protein
MDEVKNEIPDEATRVVLESRLSRSRAELAFVLGEGRTRLLAWERACRRKGVRLKLPHRDNFTSALN